MGVYVHIPFCRSKCFYCGFYSVASLRLKDAYIRAMCREMELRKEYLSREEARTLYFGGGTPSCLPLEDIGILVQKLEEIYHWETGAERTIELNPEDAEKAKLEGLRQLGFNRLSIGVQSFNDRVLKQINRRHSAAEAIAAVERASECGFRNIGIDLILGLPGYDAEQQQRDLEVITHLPVSHVSVYMLSIDSGSVFERLSQQGKFTAEDEDTLAERYLAVSDFLKNIGFEHYEISNFARDFKYGFHNTAYWQQQKYIGFGAAAHSYDGTSRQWNVAQIKTYIDHLNKGELCFEKEELSREDCFNEYVMTALRTQWGMEVAHLKEDFPEYWPEMQVKARKYLEGGVLVAENGRWRLTEQGWLISDGIFSDLFTGKD